MGKVEIIKANQNHHPAIWQMLEPVLRSGETYALPRDWSKTEALGFWCAPEKHSFVAIINDQVVGTYYLKANQLGGGSHVANCGYITSAAAQGKGIAKAMCAHSLDKARQLGFKAMQFNCVVASNTRAIDLWHKMGFATVGTLPNAFAHPSLGFVDAYVMYQGI